MKKYNIAILGATGAVGQEFLSLIEENYSVNNDVKEVKRTKLKRW